MVYLIGVISLISLTLNYMIYKRVNTTYLVGTLEEITAPAIYCCCKVEHLESEPQEKAAPEPMVQDVYQAWTNRKEIPWVPPTPAPEPVINTPNRGPLARPDGFV